MTSIEGHGFLVVLKWIELHDEDEGDQNPEADGGYIQGEGDSLSTDTDIEDEAPNELELSTVAFKCVGVTRDPQNQEALRSANQLIQNGKDVPVQLLPEPTNPFDSRAISFQCHINNQRKTIGYVTKEACDSVDEALESNNVVSTKFAWVKNKTLRTSGPGFYTAIDVTRKGTWSTIVKQSANAMF